MNPNRGAFRRASILAFARKEIRIGITTQREKSFAHVHRWSFATETLCGHKCGNDFENLPIYHYKSIAYVDKLVTPTGIEPVFQP